MTSPTYFEHSQLVKRGVQSDTSLLDRLRDAFDGGVEGFAYGGTVNLFRFGKQLPSGLWVALRAFRPEVYYGKCNLESQKEYMEIYCQNAEFLAEQGEEVPRFCIGTIYKEQAGIITEDLTANGQHEIDHPEDEPHCFVGDGRRRVFVDIDGVFGYAPGMRELKYFADDAVLDLGRR